MSRRCTCCQVSYPYPYSAHFYSAGHKLGACCKRCVSRKSKQRYQDDDNVKIQARYHALSQRSRKHGVPCCTRAEFDTLFLEDVVCPYCESHVNGIADLNVDHVLPLTLGGNSLLANLQLCCRWCNAAKHDDEAGFLDWLSRLKRRSAALTIGQDVITLQRCMPLISSN